MTAFHIYLSSPKVKKVLKTKPGEEGFSLIELVVVVAVLAILAAIAIPSFTAIQSNAAQAVRKLIRKLEDSSFEVELDSGLKLCVELSVDKNLGNAILGADSWFLSFWFSS